MYCGETKFHSWVERKISHIGGVYRGLSSSNFVKTTLFFPLPTQPDEPLIIKISGIEKVLSKNILFHKNYDPKKIGAQKFGQNEPVTPEILLIWTNVTRAYVAWKNVTITVGIF